MIDSMALLYMLTTLVVLVTALWLVNPTQLVSRVRESRSSEGAIDVMKQLVSSGRDKEAIGLAYGALARGEAIEAGGSEEVVAIVLEGDVGARDSDAELGRTPPAPVGELGTRSMPRRATRSPGAGEAGAVVATLNGRDGCQLPGGPRVPLLQAATPTGSRTRGSSSTGAGPVTMAAIAAVDAALWDINGKAAGMPLYRSSGKIAAACTSIGPGATNTLTGLGTAYADSMPFLLLTGAQHTYFAGRGILQEVGRSHQSVFPKMAEPVLKAGGRRSASFPTCSTAPSPP
jgi:hypothetical protein